MSETRWLEEALDAAAGDDELPVEGDWDAVRVRAAALARPRRRRLPALTLAAAASVAAVAITLALTRDVERGGGLSPIERARAALVVPRDGVFHVRIEFSGPDSAWNETWQSASTYVSASPGRPASGGRAAGVEERYDPASNTIEAWPVPRLDAAAWWFSDVYTADMRRLLARPGSQVLGERVVHGVRCVQIRLAADRGTKNDLYADAVSYRPVLQRVAGPSSTQEVWFRIWEVLPADEATRRQTDLRLRYPDAVVREIPPPDGSGPPAGRSPRTA